MNWCLLVCMGITFISILFSPPMARAQTRLSPKLPDLMSAVPDKFLTVFIINVAGDIECADDIE